MRYTVILFLGIFFVMQCAHLSMQNRENNQMLIKEGDSFTVSLNNNELLDKNISDNKDYPQLMSWIKKKEWDKSIQMIKDELRKKPFDENLLTLLATSLYNKGNYVTSNFYAHLVLEKVNPSNAHALNILGLTKIRTAKSLSDYVEASEDFKKSFAASKTEVAAGLNLGYLQQETGQHEVSLKTFSEVSERCEHCTSSLLGLAIVHNRLERYEKAKEYIDEILDKEPNHIFALYQLALYYRNHEKNKSKFEGVLQSILEKISPDQIAMQRKVKLLLNASL